MFRLIGFVVGVAIATIVLTTLVDAPMSTAIRVAKDRLWQRAATTQSNDIHLDQKASLPKHPQADGPQELPLAIARDDALGQAPSQTEIKTTSTPSRPEVASGFEAQANNSSTLWQAVWDPFRSHWAASGFAGRLGRLTNLEFRVRRLPVGGYQVEVGYNPHEGITDTLTQIRRVTGLRIRELQP